MWNEYFDRIPCWFLHNEYLWFHSHLLCDDWYCYWTCVHASSLYIIQYYKKYVGGSTSPTTEESYLGSQLQDMALDHSFSTSSANPLQTLQTNIQIFQYKKMEPQSNTLDQMCTIQFLRCSRYCLDAPLS